MDKQEVSRIVENARKWPKRERPGWDYYYDTGNEEWVKVNDDDDMTFWYDRILCNPQGAINYPPSMRMSGKDWKKIFCEPNKNKPLKYAGILL